MNKEYLLLPCAICKHVPKMKEHIQDGELRAIFIDCDGCYTHGPFKHVGEHGIERAKESCAEDWNTKQKIFMAGIA